MDNQEKSMIQGYLTKNYNTNTDIKEVEESTLKDYATQYNMFGMGFFHPETMVTDKIKQDKWDKEEQAELYDTLEDPEDQYLLAESVNSDHFNILLERKAIRKDAEERIGQDNMAVQVGTALVTSIVDPTILIPGTLAFKGVKTVSVLKNIAYGAATFGAVSAVQEEVLAEQTGREANVGSAALFGSVLGGTLSGLGRFVAGNNTQMSESAAKALLEPNDVEKSVSGMLDDMKISDDGNFVTYLDENGVKKQEAIVGTGLEPQPIHFGTPQMNNFVSKFVITPVSRLAKSKYPLFNKLGSMIESSPISRTLNGKVFVESTNASDIKQQLVSFKTQALKDIDVSYHHAKSSGFKGSKAEYDKEVFNSVDNIINEVTEKAHSRLAQEIGQLENVANLERIKISNKARQIRLDKLKNLIKNEKNLEKRQQLIKQLEKQSTDYEQVALTQFNEKFESSRIKFGKQNYDTRLNELLKEEVGNIDYTKIPDYILPGVKSYQKYSATYAKRMNNIKMLDEATSHPLIYKTRSWNLQRLNNIAKDDLTRIIRQAFINDTYNKAMINAEKLTPKQIDKAVNDIVEHMQQVDLVRMMPDNTLTVPSSMPLGQYLEAKNFRLNDKYLEDLIDRDIASVMESYNYQMSGRVALQQMFGTDNLATLKKEVVLPAAEQARLMGATEKEIGNLSDDFDTLFTQILGTHGMPAKPNAWGERFTRKLLKFNYLTFGGGFGINALTDMGVVAFTNGFSNTMKHFAPSLKAITSGIKEGTSAPWVEQAIALGAASDYYHIRTLSRFDDLDTMFTGDRMEKLLDRGGQVMSNVSGLAPITAMEELMAIGGGTVDMIRTAQKFKKTGKLPRGFEEKIARYGLSKEDLLWVADQPVKIKNNVLYDFNWNEWTDKTRMDKFQRAVTSAMNDSVVRGDKTLLPNYMTTANPFMKLITQFLRYPHIAYERVLLRGASKPTARFLTGTMTSAAIMGSIYYLREQALIEAGLIKERDAKYQIYDRFGRLDEDAMNRLSWTVLSKLPQMGMTTDILNKGIAIAGQPTPGRTYDENFYTALGGVSASRLDSLHKGIKSIADGEFDSMQGYYMGKQMVPFQNLLNIDQLYNPVVKEYIEKGY